MKTHAFRLTYGSDLKKSIENYITVYNIQAGFVGCCVGCLYECTFRLADGHSLYHQKDRFEIVSLCGTLSKDGVHLHLSLSDENGHTIGGHLMEGCLVNTTAEIVLIELLDQVFTREYDESTGYDEIIMKAKE